MNGVLGGVELLLSDPSILTGEQKELLGIIKSSGEAMLTLINDILDLSKIEVSQLGRGWERIRNNECDDAHGVWFCVRVRAYFRPASWSWTARSSACAIA